MAIRIYSLAKEFRVDPRLLVDECANLGVHGKGSSLASLTHDEEALVRTFLMSKTTLGARLKEALDGEAATATFASCGIKELPPALFKCTTLRHLDLSRNLITSLPNEFASLTQLESVVLSHNRLTAFPTVLYGMPSLTRVIIDNNGLNAWANPNSLQLPNIEELDLSHNKLSQVISSIGALTRLTSLNLTDNALDRLPDALGHLSALQDLFLAGNKLSELPRSLGDVSTLRTLDLENNELTSLLESLGSLSSLSTLKVSGNPLPATVLAIAERGTEDIKTYLRGVARDGGRLNEAKLVVVGEGNVGKSCVVAALRREQFIENRDTTHGIDVGHLRLTHPETFHDVHIHTWDFGGQRLYRITHQFFYSKRSLYIVVWWPREGAERNDVEGWIRRILLRVGSDARVMVVSTHCDTGERIPRLYKDRLRKDFGEIILGFFDVDSATGSGFDKLRDAIATAASNLPHMNDEVSQTWMAARTEITSISKPSVPYSKIVAICGRRGLDKQATATLIHLMNDLGDVIHFDDDEGLKDLVVLQPEWLTKAIGYLLEDRALNDAGGMLKHGWLQRIWNEHGIQSRPRYAFKTHPYFLRLMEKFDVSYRLDRGNTSLVAQLVPESPPALLWRPVDNPVAGELQLSLIFELDAEPPGLMPWLIVRCHRYSCNAHWQEGVFIEHKPHGCGLIELVDGELRLTVRAEYPSHLMTLLADTVEFLIRERWPGLSYACSVPCYISNQDGKPCKGRLRLEVLRKRQRDGKLEATCPICGADLDISRLLSGFEAPDVAVAERLDELTELVQSSAQNSASGLSHLAHMSRLLIRALGTETKECPRIISIIPTDLNRFNPTNVGMEALCLNLWCEMPGQLHPVCPIGTTGLGGYEIKRPSKWLAKVGPYLKLVKSLVAATLPATLQGYAVSLDSRLLQDIEPTLELMEKSVEAAAKVSDLLGVKTLETDFDSLTIDSRPEGAGLRELHELLLEIDPVRRWGGLRPVVTGSGDYVWLCPRHSKEYEPALPKLPYVG
jgi:internalin A